MVPSILWRPMGIGKPAPILMAPPVGGVGADDDDERPGPGLDADAPLWVRIAIQVLVILVTLAVWAYSTLTRVQRGLEPDFVTFGILGLVVTLAYGRVMRAWWKGPK